MEGRKEGRKEGRYEGRMNAEVRTQRREEGRKMTEGKKEGHRKMVAPSRAEDTEAADSSRVAMVAGEGRKERK